VKKSKLEKTKIWKRESRHHDWNHGRVYVGDCPQSRRATSRRLKGVPEAKRQTQWTIESSDSGSTFGCDSKWAARDWAHPNHCLNHFSLREKVELHDLPASQLLLLLLPNKPTNHLIALTLLLLLLFLIYFFCMYFNFMFYRFYIEKVIF